MPKRSETTSLLSNDCCFTSSRIKIPIRSTLISNQLQPQKHSLCNSKVEANNSNTSKSKSNRRKNRNSSNSNSNNNNNNNNKNSIFQLTKKMANTLSLMTNALRNAVSRQRIRYTENGFNLDLAYICENIIAMGYPAENIEGIYRNRIDDVYQFFEGNHPDHYKIYNLCSERSYDISKFHSRVGVYPFDDHNPPTIELIQDFCDDVDRWLKADKKNVAAVHCKAGKGRTGTMICCYLLHSGFAKTAEDALAHYDEKRTKDRKGVTIPSQRRYVEYYSKLISSGQPYERRTVQICEIKFSLNNQSTVICSISSMQDPSKAEKNPHSFTIDFRKSQTIEINDRCIPLTGDVKIEVFHKVMRKKEKYFHFWFNTYFLCDDAECISDGDDITMIYELTKNELDDAHKDKEHKIFPENFKVQLILKPVPSRGCLGDNESSTNNHHNAVLRDQQQNSNHKNHNQHNINNMSDYTLYHNTTLINMQNKTNIGPITTQESIAASGGCDMITTSLNLVENNKIHNQQTNYRHADNTSTTTTTAANNCKNHQSTHQIHNRHHQPQLHHSHPSHLHSNQQQQTPQAHHYQLQQQQQQQQQQQHNYNNHNNHNNTSNSNSSRKPLLTHRSDMNNGDEGQQQQQQHQQLLLQHQQQQQQQQQQQPQQLNVLAGQRHSHSNLYNRHGGGNGDNSNDVRNNQNSTIQHNTPSVSPDVSRSNSSNNSSSSNSISGSCSEASSVIGEDWESENHHSENKGKPTTKNKLSKASTNDDVVMVMMTSSASSNFDDTGSFAGIGIGIANDVCVAGIKNNSSNSRCYLNNDSRPMMISSLRSSVPTPVAATTITATAATSPVTPTATIIDPTTSRRQTNLPLSTGVKSMLTKNFKGRPRREST